MNEGPLTFAQHLLAADEEPVAGCRRILLAYLAENERLLGDLTADLDLAVHEARKNVKRMRAMLRLLRRFWATTPSHKPTVSSRPPPICWRRCVIERC